MRYHRTGRDHWNPRQPSGLLREQIHGPLHPLEDKPTLTPLRFAGQLAVLVFIAAEAWLLIIMVS